MVIASHNLDCLLKDVSASPPLLRFFKQVTTLGLMEALGSEWAAWQALAWLLHLTTWATFSRKLKGEPKKKFLFENTRIVLLFLEIFITSPHI